MFDPLIGEVAILALVALALLTWARHRERTRRDIALALVPLAILILSQWLRDRAGFDPVWTSRVGLWALILHPVLLLRVIHYHVPVPRAVRIAAWFGFAIAAAFVTPHPQPLPPLSALVGATYFGAVEIYVAVQLFGGAGPARGVLRRRLRLAGLGSLALGLAVAIAAVDIAVWPELEALERPTYMVVFVSAGLFYFGFLTPKFLRTSWAMEEVRRLFLELSGLTVSEREEHAMQLLCRAGQSAAGGTVATALIREVDDEPLAIHQAEGARTPAEIGVDEASLRELLNDGAEAIDIATDTSPAVRALSAPGDRVLLRAPIASSERQWGALFVSMRRLPLFAEDDLTVLGWLAEHVALRLDADAAARGRARLVRQLQEANAELQRFAYVASHDLQEPLRMVSSFAQLLERRYRGKLDRDADDFIGYLVDGANRMQRLIQDLLMFSRAGTAELRREPVALEAVLERALRNLAATIQEAGAEVTYDDLPEVVGDETQLLQLFQNLIGNAIKFRRDEPPAVHVAAERAGDRVQVRISDNGEGIPPEQLERLFLPFMRLHGREIPGTGIGLAICKRVVERHGGTITIESEVGRGTAVIFTLPAREAKEQPPPLSSAA